MVVLTLYHEKERRVSKICDMKAAFLHPDMPLEMFIEWPKGIVDLGIITKEFLKEHFILLGNLMYGNVNIYLLWLRLLDKYSFNECNLKRSKADSCIFYKKYDNGELELVMSVHVDNVFMEGNPETLDKIKEKIKLYFNIQRSSKLNRFLILYYK